MRRVLSGSVADTSRASERLAPLLGGSATPAAEFEFEVEGETVGNSPDGSVGEVTPEGSGGSPPDPSPPEPSVLGSVDVDVDVDGDGVLAATTSMVAAEWKEPCWPAPWP